MNHTHVAISNYQHKNIRVKKHFLHKKWGNLLVTKKVYPAGIYLFKVSSGNTRKTTWNLFKVNNKDTRRTSGVFPSSFLTYDISSIWLVEKSTILAFNIITFDQRKKEINIYIYISCYLLTKITKIEIEITLIKLIEMYSYAFLWT